MMKAFAGGVPTNGQPVPDGAVMAKVAWSRQDNPLLPGAAMVPGTLRKVQFMVKDARRFPGTDGWGYANFHLGRQCSRVQGRRHWSGLGEDSLSPVPHAGQIGATLVFTQYARGSR